jgi:hypothetical protein
MILMSAHLGLVGRSLPACHVNNLLIRFDVCGQKQHLFAFCCNRHQLVLMFQEGDASLQFTSPLGTGCAVHV